MSIAYELKLKKNNKHSICRPFNTAGALERAKYAVESQYAVVGVLEDLNTTLTVFEKYIPKFFAGVTDIYYGNLFGAAALSASR